MMMEIYLYTYTVVIMFVVRMWSCVITKKISASYKYMSYCCILNIYWDDDYGLAGYRFTAAAAICLVFLFGRNITEQHSFVFAIFNINNLGICVRTTLISSFDDVRMAMLVGRVSWPRNAPYFMFLFVLKLTRNANARFVGVELFFFYFLFFLLNLHNMWFAYSICTRFIYLYLMITIHKTHSNNKKIFISFTKFSNSRWIEGEIIIEN